MNYFNYRTQKLVEWYQKGLITKEQAMREFKQLLAQGQGNYNLEDAVKAQMSDKLLGDL